MNLDEILRAGLKAGATDFHFRPNKSPVIRIHGEIGALDNAPVLEPEELEQAARGLLNPSLAARFERDGGVDFPYAHPDLGRFRASVFQAQGETGLAFRVIPFLPPIIDQLSLPPLVERLALEERGLILVTGPAGNGKSTTLAAMINYIARSRRCHILTIEDPIEFLFQDHLALVTQREVGSDTVSFAEALRLSFRLDPNVIMVGEMRDLETTTSVLTLAETGHLVLSTLHTLNAAETINRIISQYPAHHERQIRSQLAQVLRGVISLRLMPRADRAGRIPACEVMVSTATIQRCIEDPARTAQITEAIAQGQDIYGMQTFDQCIFTFFRDGLISYESALRYCTTPIDFEIRVARELPDRVPSPSLHPRRPPEGG